MACSPAAAPPPGPPPSLDALFPTASAPSSSASNTASPAVPAQPLSAQAPCQSDEDCGYDPTSARCGADPRFNKQPPLVDQGLVCYCDASSRACALLRVEPAPCEGEPSCAIHLDPRPHPVRASADHPYKKPGACRPPRGAEPRRTDLFTTCERTNICTMNRRDCAAP